jgi:hypothetical protein
VGQWKKLWESLPWWTNNSCANLPMLQVGFIK